VIDPALKWQLRRKLKQIHHELEVTLIYVTHDQTEALTFADRVVVMDRGAVLQQGTPQELFENPQHVFVGHFIGSPGMNLMPCTMDGGTAVIGMQRVALLPERIAGSRAGQMTLGIRPEFVRLFDPGNAALLHVSVEEVEPLGGHQVIHARLGDTRIAIKAEPEIGVAPGVCLSVWLPRAHIKLYSDGRLVA